MIERLAGRLLALPRVAKRMLALSADAALCAACVWIAFCLRLDKWTAIRGVQWGAVVVAIGFVLPLFALSGLYRAILRYAESAFFSALMRACAMSRYRTAS